MHLLTPEFRQFQIGSAEIADTRISDRLAVAHDYERSHRSTAAIGLGAPAVSAAPLHCNRSHPFSPSQR
jgi:hypothetical protein